MSVAVMEEQEHKSRYDLNLYAKAYRILYLLNRDEVSSQPQGYSTVHRCRICGTKFKYRSPYLAHLKAHREAERGCSQPHVQMGGALNMLGSGQPVKNQNQNGFTTTKHREEFWIAVVTFVVSFVTFLVVFVTCFTFLRMMTPDNTVNIDKLPKKYVHYFSNTDEPVHQKDHTQKSKESSASKLKQNDQAKKSKEESSKLKENDRMKRAKEANLPPKLKENGQTKQDKKDSSPSKLKQNDNAKKSKESSPPKVKENGQSKTVEKKSSSMNLKENGKKVSSAEEVSKYNDLSLELEQLKQEGLELEEVKKQLLLLHDQLAKEAGQN